MTNLDMTLRMNRAPAPFRKTVTLVASVPAFDGFYWDQFNGGGVLQSHTSDSGHTYDAATNLWGIDGSTIELVAGVATCQTNGGSGIATAVPASADYYVECDVHVDETSAQGTDIYFGGRVVDADSNAYLAEIFAFDNVTTVYLYKVLAGAWTELGNSVLANNRDFTIRLTLNAGAQILAVDGVDTITAADGDISAAGRIMLAWNDDAPGYPNTGILEARADVAA